MRFSTALTSISTAVVLLASPFSAAQAAYSQIVAFGDSLSDNGNAFAATKGALGFGIPVAPYWNGRFSNGPVAVEVMAQTLGVSLVDYAFGGALTGMANRVGIPGLPGIQTQVTQFTTGLSAAGKTADASALYFLWGGGNDFFSATDKSAAVGVAIANLTGEVGQLYGAGAREFFVPLLPDLSNTLDSIQGGPVAQAQAHALSQAFNGNLTVALQNLQGSLSGATIHIFDPNPVLGTTRDAIVAAGGITTAPCWTGDYTGGSGTLCTNPDLHTLWDGVHPTARLHDAMGHAMAAAVPEPATFGLALVGLLIAGAAASRQRRA
ncbi:MAG: PEP-CTERM sorting domain-containing protein [Rubrivivax sp.]|nr:MAG: PEP-CTERM sorting domain-containing protein [Rubrivivax sp.]